jgi:hypothetical protein
MPNSSLLLWEGDVMGIFQYEELNYLSKKVTA